MAVYRHDYTQYDGPLTSAWSRFLVLPRYSLPQLFKSRFLLAFFVACFVWPVAGAVLIYLHHNVSALSMLQLEIKDLLAIDNGFFAGFLSFQSAMGFLLAALVGPGLVSPDLVNNGLPLYFSRPFTKTEYVLGKLTVIAGLLSLVTWIPGLILFGLQSSLVGLGWLTENWRIAVALFLCAWIWILVVSLLALALSAWVKWRPVAAALLFVLFFAAAAFGEAANEILDTRWGNLLNIGKLINTVWNDLFGLRPENFMPVWMAWVALVVMCLASLWMLSRRLKAYEVVR